MYFIVYNQVEERIYQDIDQVANHLTQGWKLYGFTDSEDFAYSLLYECQNY